MNIEIKVLGTEDAMNTWTMAMANINGKTYKIQMVKFDDPSEYGIRQGRISKLYIADSERNIIVNYDRGWDVRPKNAEAQALFNAIIKKFN